jgi:DNA-binding transcriptional MerR regulator
LNGVPLAIGEVAKRLGVSLWQVRRLYQRGLLPPAPRVGHMRVVSEDKLPVIREALERGGYLQPADGEAASVA